METVFDHNITTEEWNYICGMRKELYLKVVDEETARQDLASLYHLRGADRSVVEKYLEGLSPLVVLNFWRTVTHP